MAGKPIVTVGSMHVCPMCSGTVPHVGGPVIGPGAPNVLINGKPAAVMGDACTCVGPPSSIAMGEPTVLINGVAAVTVGAITNHGGSITIGEANVTISAATPSAATPKPNNIKFPEITIIKKTVASTVGKLSDMKLAESNITETKERQDKESEQHGQITKFNVSL